LSEGTTFSEALVQNKGLVTKGAVTRTLERELPVRPARNLSFLWVIDDGVEDLAGRGLCIVGADETGEVLTPVAFFAGADDRAVRNRWRRLLHCLVGSSCSIDRSLPKSHQDKKW